MMDTVQCLNGLRLATNKKGIRKWAPFEDATEYFQPSSKGFMINYRVENIEALVKELKQDRITVLMKLRHLSMEDLFIYIELWEPVEAFEKGA